MFRIAFGLFFGFLGFAVGLMLQVGPHSAGSNFCSWLPFWPSCSGALPDWFDRYAWALPAFLLGAAACLLLWAPGHALIRLATKRHGLIPLREAAATIYGEIRGTDLGRFTEGHSGTEEEILDNVGMQILHNADVQVRRAPSPNWELFPKSELSKMGVFQGATGIRYWGENQAFYTEPKVSRRDMRRVARFLKENANYIQQWSKAPPQETAANEFLRIEVGESGPFKKTTGSLYGIKRTFNIKLSNVHDSKSAEFCKLQIVSIENQTEYEGPWILKEWRTLPAGDHDFIPLATYGEAREPQKYNCADSFFVVLVEPNQPKLDIEKEYIVVLRATAHDIPQREFRCKLWVGNDGRFHIEKA